MGYIIFDWLKNIWDKSILHKRIISPKKLDSFSPVTSFLWPVFCGLRVTGLILLDLFLINNSQWRWAPSLLLLTYRTTFTTAPRLYWLPFAK